MSAVTAGNAFASEPAGRRPTRRFAPATIMIYTALIFFAIYYLIPLYVMVGDLAEGPRGGAARQHLRAASRDHLRALGQGVGLRLHRPLLRGAEGRIPEIGLHHHPERDRLDRRRIGQRLRAGELALQGIGVLLHRSSSSGRSSPTRSCSFRSCSSPRRSASTARSTP